jgi:hypothetical protein
MCTATLEVMTRGYLNRLGEVKGKPGLSGGWELIFQAALLVAWGAGAAAGARMARARLKPSSAATL